MFFWTGPDQAGFLVFICFLQFSAKNGSPLPLSVERPPVTRDLFSTIFLGSPIPGLPAGQQPAPETGNRAEPSWMLSLDSF